MKAILNHLNRDYLYLQLESISTTEIHNNKTLSASSNIVLETGTIFKEIETKKLFKHKIVILDQVIIYVCVIINVFL